MTEGKFGIVIDGLLVVTVTLVATPIVLILMGYHVITGK